MGHQTPFSATLYILQRVLLSGIVSQFLGDGSVRVTCFTRKIVREVRLCRERRQISVMAAATNRKQSENTKGFCLEISTNSPLKNEDTVSRNRCETVELFRNILTDR